MKKIILIITILLTLTLSSCNKAEENIIKVIATNIPHGEILNEAKPLLKEKGFNLEIIITSDYYFPNPALASKDADANFFQHLPFLNAYNNENKGKELVVALGVHIEPIGIYSKKYQSLAEIDPGSTVLISNSTSDHGRILKLFSDANLITLSEDFDIYSTNLNFEEIIISNPKGIVFRKDAAPDLLIAAYNSNEADLYVINSNYALEGNLNPVTDSIFIEQTTNNPYVNVLVTRAELLESPKIKALIEALSSEHIKNFINTKHQGSVINA